MSGEKHEGLEVTNARERGETDRVWLRYVALRTTPFNLSKPEALSRLVSEEVAAEREACAKIADEHASKAKAATERFAHPTDGDEDKEIAHSKWAAMARLIAAAIRSRSPSPQ